MIAGYILSGGQNRRMNGEKKLMLTYQGKSFYERIQQTFSIFPSTYLSVESEAPYKALGMPMVVDVYPQVGPMGGIYSGLVTCNEEALFITACDMPFIDRQTVEKVLRVYEATGITTIVKTGRRIHPLFGIYPKSILPYLKMRIERGQYRMMDLLAEIEKNVVELDDDKVVSNINTRDEYEKLKGEAMGQEFSHFDQKGNAIMVDVSEKQDTKRVATASGKIKVSPAVMEAVETGTSKKGDVLGVARVAGIMAVKQTASLIPMCHTLLIQKCSVDFELLQDTNEIKATCI